ncbi:unnamed protein product [Caenorhabditis auriculariae]|uniref:GRIP domain-containing protein n=1 Tax=Caenorhabditis auriculariae TaxID=2777116 RepID=A0A8S1GSB3_9PELO|nr:unnamed protein product [Caenorhabditis auriculariae]
MLREETLTSQDDEMPSTSASQTGEVTPKKGILKRPSLKNESEKRDLLFPLPGFRASPDRFPEKPGTRIPKLQVTWWEKNAVAFIGETSDENNTDSEQLMKDLGGGPREIVREVQQQPDRQTAILDSEDSEDLSEVREEMHLENSQDKLERDFDETMSVASSTGSASSAVVGRWWTGKDTRYVPHCHKKGCNHASHSDVGEYITPTQRRNKELSQLKKELRQVIAERDERDQHLTALRDKVKEIEILNEAQGALTEGQRIARKEQQAREALEKDKKMMEKKHAVRVSQLVQETMAAREESIKLTSRINELENLLNKPTHESSTQTDFAQPEPVITVLTPMSPPDPSDPNQIPVQASPKVPLVNAQTSVPENLNIVATSPALISPLNITIDSQGKTQMFCNQEALSHHIQACQNEAFIWRTKAAQLEIVAKDQLLKIASLEAQLALHPRPQNDFISPKNLLSPSVSQTLIPRLEMKENGVGSTDILADTMSPLPFSFGNEECSSVSCAEKKSVLAQDISGLNETIEEAKIRVRELEDDVSVLRKEIEKIEDEKGRMEGSLQQAKLDNDSKSAEIAASLTTAHRLQNERDTMQKAIDYMENRMQVYRNTLMEHDLVVSDEAPTDWRKTTIDPRYNIMLSKKIQTTLTSQQMSEHESEFHSTQQKLHELSQEFSAKKSTLASRFEEVEQILLAKTELVEALSKQLEDTRRQQRTDMESHQRERENYKKTLEETSAVAEKVPVLERQMAQLVKEKNEFELKFKEQKEEFEDGLARSLEESLSNYKEQANYWSDKLATQESQMERLKKENAGLTKELEEQKMQNHLQKAELQRKLVSSIEHVEQLQSKIHKSRRDVECQAKPRFVNKYVACRPNSKHRSTGIEKGDLFDETDERLRICQTELATTRRQVTVLQQKLITVIQQQHVDQAVRKRSVVAEIVPPLSPEHGNSTSDRLRTLDLKNKELSAKVCTLEVEKSLMATQEKSRIQKLVTEFDNVRKKLDEDMNMYSKEKQWLQWRISNLEKDNTEMQSNVEKLQQKLADQSPFTADRISLSSLRKTNSEPEIGRETSCSDEMSSQNVTFGDLGVKMTVRQSVAESEDEPKIEPPCFVTPAVAPFSNLADVLNLVRSDLEQVLTQIEEPESAQILMEDRLNEAASASFETSMLDDVMTEWAQDELKSMGNQLRRSKEERNILQKTNDRLSKELQVANAELEVFKREKPTSTSKPNMFRLVKSSSATDLYSKTDAQDVVRWKQQSGTMFRELNRIRKDLAKALDQNRELRYQLAITRGDLEMNSCGGEWASSCPLSPSLSYHTAVDVPRANETVRADELVVHDSGERFERGSNRASVACSVIVRSESADRLKSKSVSRERVDMGKERERARSRSASRRNPATKDVMARREQRRQLRLPKNDSMSSSMTSVYITSRENQPKLPPMMSQSWHEKTLENAERPTNNDARPTRVVSLREKVGRLTRENRELHDYVEFLRLRANGQANSHVLELERETEDLRKTIEQLVTKVSSGAMTTSGPSQKQYQLLQDEVEIRRKESAMYEKKISDLEQERREMYVVMFKKGQQAANIELEEARNLDVMTQDRITLKFLHDAFYYFLLNKGDSKEHLAAMMTMLDFTASQKDEVHRRRGRST